jgi:hypothetical protein
VIVVRRWAGEHVPAPLLAVARRLHLVFLGAGLVLGLTPVAALAAGTGDAGPLPHAPSLPMLRWANAVATIHTHYGVGSVVSSGDPFLTAISGLMFQVAALLWQLLGTLVKVAQGSDLVHQTVFQVNPVYHTIGGALLGTTGATSIVVLVILVAAGMVAYQAFRKGSGVSGALRGLAGVLLPVGLLFVTVSSADQAASSTVDTPGSPSWAVQKVSGWTTALSGSVAQVSDQFGSVGTAGITGSQDATMATCAKYIDGLDNLYTQQQSTPGAGPSSLQVADSVVLSQIWESAVMAPWITAQFGSGPLGDKAFCHLLEIQANVSGQDQVQAMASDVPGGPYSKSSPGPTWSQLVAGQPYVNGVSPPKYATLLGPDFANGDDDLRRNMIAWATCDYVGPVPGADDRWNVDPAFDKVFESAPSDLAKTCSTWWGQGTTKPPPKGGTFTTNGPFDFEDENAIQAATHAQNTDSVDARNYIQGLNGHNAGLALSTSLLALVSSITYAWSLGGLALGVLIGKLSLIILVACGPIFLLLAAVPSVTTRRAASKAFGLTFAALLSTFTFSVLMGLMLLFIGLLQDVTFGLFSSDARTLPGLVEGLIPLAALYLLRKLLRLVGMDSITSLRGAIKTTAAFGQLGTAGGQPVPLRSRLRQVADLTGAAGALRGRRSASGPHPVAMERPTLPNNRPPAPAAPLPWNRAWRHLLDARPGGEPHPTAGPTPPPIPELNAGKPPPPPALPAGPHPPAGLPPATAPPWPPRPPAFGRGATAMQLSSRPPPPGRLLLPAGVDPVPSDGAGSRGLAPVGQPRPVPAGGGPAVLAGGVGSPQPGAGPEAGAGPERGAGPEPGAGAERGAGGEPGAGRAAPQPPSPPAEPDTDKARPGKGGLWLPPSR